MKRNINKNHLSALTSSKGELGCVGHMIALVKNNQLDAFAHELLSTTERFNFFSDHIDASIVGCIQFKSHALVVLTIELLCYSDHA